MKRLAVLIMLLFGVLLCSCTQRLSVETVSLETHSLCAEIDGRELSFDGLIHIVKAVFDKEENITLHEEFESGNDAYPVLRKVLIANAALSTFGTIQYANVSEYPSEESAIHAYGNIVSADVMTVEVDSVVLRLGTLLIESHGSFMMPVFEQIGVDVPRHEIRVLSTRSLDGLTYLENAPDLNQILLAAEKLGYRRLPESGDYFALCSPDGQSWFQIVDYGTPQDLDSLYDFSILVDGLDYEYRLWTVPAQLHQPETDARTYSVRFLTPKYMVVSLGLEWLDFLNQIKALDSI